jgi:two-component system response regulator AtoC
LTHYFLSKYCFEFKKEPLEIPEKITKLFLTYKWPGNVRELENLIRRAIIVRDWNFLYDELNLQEAAREMEELAATDPELFHMNWDDEKVKGYFNEDDFSLKKISKAFVAEAERMAISKALQETQWNRTKAAQILRVSYKTLLNRIDEFDLTP